METIVYKYFLGCANYQEVKTRYRELAKQYHPDKPNGDKVKFQELVDEYSILGEGNYYPIRNFIINDIPHSTRKSSKVTYEEAGNYQGKTTTLSQEELENARAINYFASLRLSDITFDYIDEVVKKAKKDKLNKLWIYQEIQKKWDLNLDHFKYVTFLNKDKVSTAKELYRKYQLNVV